ncbi:GAF domain-containing protein [Aliiglaciecola sp. CAU 1673]|uniref:GAF domain-containing protein n=1 Tax=Aliiglaciecola sp. CAU 1673 TaxID=3032595 RepID=UPI0023DA6C27|nr:GAF domain-containing protein [Aliiglaciecola sp. CAU 1673]MDF2177539.1 GAF domain-containing protein [Aliiglaciecola sp. CAU 1673]
MPIEKTQLYREISQQAVALVEDESDLIANLANISALLWMHLHDINWSGFYLLKGNELVLGPFQGKPACVRIPLGKGVCGTAAAEEKPQLVMDVHQFDGHIACDAASNSEVVIPFYLKGKLAGVLDIDSPSLARFDEQDLQGLQSLMHQLEEHLE